MFGVFYLQSEYSLLNNLIPLNKLISLAKEGGYDFVALSDNNNLYGMYEFFKLAKANDLKPIIGMKIEVNYGVNKTGFLIYVENEIGYKNLLKISNIINVENRNLDYDELINLQEGLIIISSGDDSLIDAHINNGDIPSAESITIRFKRDFKNFYIGLSLHSVNHEFKIAPSLTNLAIRLEVMLLPLQKTSYLLKEDKQNYLLLRGIDNQSYLDQDEGDLSFLTKEELEYRFLDYSFVFKNVSDVIKKINFEFEVPKLELPSPKTSNLSPADELRMEAFKGLEERLSKPHSKPKEEYIKRLNYELDIIINLNFPNYFLIVSDFVKHAKRKGILVGPGRGSGASSLVSYCLYITEVDPLKYDLLFERFLNPVRISMPDIDLDFPDDRRDEVIEYVANKYGHDHIASIITFDTFQFNSSIRDLARVKNFTVAETNKLIEDIRRGTFDEDDIDTLEIINASKSLINLPRHTGTHPAGIILSSEKLKELIPLQEGPQNFPQTQWNMNHLEELGLLKIDFLGIKNLTIIDETVKLIKLTNPKFNLDDIPYDDEETYKLLQIGDTNGVFQLEQPGMQATLRTIFPTKFDDLVATLALYRPGPMANIDVYARRLKGEKYEQINPILDEILKSTYGIIVYQEQILQIANQFAGYSYAEADILRRSISKKDHDTLINEEAHFIQSATKVGRDPKLSKEVYDYIIKFADYGFNKAHSVSYAIITYQMAYLKANYFKEFATVLLSNNIGNEQLTRKYLQELRNRGYEILPPDVNKASDHYQIFGNSVMLPISIIKSIGRETTRKFLEVRDNTNFKNYHDFRVKTMNVFGEKNLENLIYAGALDSFGLNKKTMMMNTNKQELIFAASFDDVVIKKTEKEFSNEELMHFERVAYGFNIFASQYMGLVRYRHELKLEAINQSIKKKRARIIAKVTDVKQIMTKNNTPMAFIKVSDELSSVDLTVFTNQYNNFQRLKDEEYLIFNISQNEYNNRITYIVQDITKVV